MQGRHAGGHVHFSVRKTGGISCFSVRQSAVTAGQRGERSRNASYNRGYPTHCASDEPGWLGAHSEQQSEKEEDG